MKTKNLFMSILLAMLLLPMGAKAGITTEEYTDDNGIIYSVRIVDGTPEAAIVKGFDKGKGLVPNGSVVLIIPANLGNSSHSFPVIGIAANAFSGDDIKAIFKSVSIPYSVTQIGASAFEGCSNLQTVTIGNTSSNPSQLATIGEKAFRNCSKLANIPIPTSVTSIGSNAFSYCDGANGGPKVTISKSGTKTTVAASLLDGQYVKEIVVSSGITAIGAVAFHNLDQLVSVTLPTSLRTIGASAFQDCSKLTSIDIPEGVTTIKEYAFSGTPLASVSLPSTLTTINYYAFQYNNALTAIDIPKSVTSLGDKAFDCENLTSVTVNWYTPLQITAGTDPFPQKGTDGHVLHVPFGFGTEYGNDSYWGLFNSSQSPLTYVGDNGIIYGWVGDGTDNLKVIGWEGWTSPNLGVLVESPLFIGDLDNHHEYTVTEISDGAFENCQVLGAITIPSSVTRIGENAFLESSLQLAELSEGLETIGFNAFNRCESLKAITVPSTVTTIAGGAFNFCYALESADLSSCGVTNLSNQVFQNCSSLTSVNLPANLQAIEQAAFLNCSSLKSITFPLSLETIGESVFKGCGLEGTLDLNNVTTVGSDAFKDCTGLTKVIVTTDMTEFPKSAFSSTDPLTHPVRFALEVKRGERANIVMGFAQECKNITSVSIGNGVEAIGPSAFVDCTALTSVSIPESVTTIGVNAFGIANPNYTSQLTDVTVDWGMPITVDSSNDPFPADKTGIKLHVPFGKASAYSADIYWSQFNIEMPETVETTDGQTIRYRLHLGATEAENWAEVIGIYNQLVTSVDIKGSVGYYDMTFPVTTIASSAFADCESLTTVTLPSSITTIGSQAFTSKLEAVTVNATTPPALEDDGFSNATYANANLYVPEGTAEAYGAAAGWSNFYNIQALIVVDGLVYTLIDGGQAVQVVGWQGTLPSTLNIPESITVNGTSRPVTTIAAGAFQGHSGIRKVTFPTSLTTIGANAFRNCTFLANVTVPTTVQSIADDAFFSCKDNLTMDIVALDYFHTSVPASFLEGAYGIHHVNLANVEAIGAHAFENCHSLESITIPSTVRSIDWSAFDWTTSLTKVTAQWTKASEIVNNGTIFYHQYANATLYVPAGTIDLYAEAESWKDFSKIVDPIIFADDKVKAICVANWDTDEDGEICSAEAEAVTSLGQVFKGNTQIKKFQELKYFKGLKKIEVSDFEGCTKLEIVELPNTVTTIQKWAFYGCSSLQGISGGYQFRIPSSVTSIGEEAFANCKQASNIEIFGPAVIASKAFAGSLVNSNDSRVYFLSDLNSIEPDAFDETTALFTINCSNDTPIGDWLFKDCTFLKNLSVNAPIGISAFDGCTSLESVSFSDDVTSIGATAFRGCNKLQSVELPWTLQTVSNGAFGECTALTEVTINENVTSIEQYVFAGCTNLQTIIVKAVTPPTLVQNAFVVYNDATLFVPEESAQAYATTAPWSNFNKRGVIDSQGIRYTYAMVDGSPKATVVGYKGWANDLVIAGSIKGHDGVVYPVKEINTFELAQQYYQSVSIPASITKKIDVWAFCDNPNLTTVRVGWTTPLACSSEMFKNTPINPTDGEGTGILYVPAGTKDLYKNVVPWKQFATIIEYELGNANGDDTIDINDAIAIVDYIIGKAVPSAFNPLAADVNGDGHVTIADAVAVVNTILGQ